MPNKYYYLISSLPYLEFGAVSPISRDVFYDECAKWLDEEELTALKAVDAKDLEEREEAIPLVGEWKEFALETKKVVSEIRKEKHPARTERTEELGEKLGGKDPLSAEKIIEKMRWDFLEGEEYKHCFDYAWLIIYCLKVQILERLACFVKEEGERFFGAIAEAGIGKTVR